MMFKLDAKLPAWLHQVIGFSFGVIFTAWWVQATPEQVAVIRLPASIGTTVYFIAVAAFGLLKWMEPDRQ